MLSIKFYATWETKEMNVMFSVITIACSLAALIMKKEKKHK